MSRRFRFPLQPLLEHRGRIEDQKQQAVALRQIAHDEARRDLDRLDREFRESSSRLRTEHKRYDLEELRLHYAHIQFLDRAIVAQIRVVAERRTELDRSREELLAASKERKIVEKLKERRRATYVGEEVRMEQNELDDGNARQYGRRIQQQMGGAS
ncbi:MAG: flagellar export protein FliJ [Vulcanimicrobiaceae bacterium]